MIIGKKLRSLQGGRVAFMCPGCKELHQGGIRTGPDTQGPAWGYNSNPDAPTFTPSVLARWTEWHPPVTGQNLDQWKREPWEQRRVEFACHSFVTDGRIQFLTDCTHALAGQTVDLPDLANDQEDDGA